MFLYPNSSRNRPLQGHTEQLAVAQTDLYNDNSGRGAVTVLLICARTVPVVDQTWEEFQIMISEFVQIISAGFRLAQTLDFKQLLFSNHAPLLYQWEWNHLYCHVRTHLGVCAYRHRTQKNFFQLKSWSTLAESQKKASTGSWSATVLLWRTHISYTQPETLSVGRDLV